MLVVSVQVVESIEFGRVSLKPPLLFVLVTSVINGKVVNDQRISS